MTTKYYVCRYRDDSGKVQEKAFISENMDSAREYAVKTYGETGGLLLIREYDDLMDALLD